MLFAGSVSVTSLSAGPVPLAWTPPLDTSPTTLIDHLRTELRANDVLRQQNALVDVIALANCQAACNVNLRSASDKGVRIENETGVPSVLDLTALVPDLMHNYRSSPEDGTKLLALSALINVGDERSIEALVGTRTKKSDRVERTTQRSLTAFFLTRYPELKDRAVRSGSFSLADVVRLRQQRARDARKLAKQARRG
jgi:hypothetical protein